MINEMSVTGYCQKYSITRHAVHRRIKKFEKMSISVNNIVGIKRIGSKIVVLLIDNDILFKKKKYG